MNLRSAMHKYSPNLTKYENFVVKVDSKLSLDRINKYLEKKSNLSSTDSLKNNKTGIYFRMIKTQFYRLVPD